LACSLSGELGQHTWVSAFEGENASVYCQTHTFKVSSIEVLAGLTHAIINVLEFPPRESCKIRVNLESR
jgi:hypothetical protein